ncbi:MAG: HD family phosphohydrolase, partial [Phaeodactylibacter sp.]|nr:HD family phosphohydrolase [Phaeodactylibacter sp.]
GMASLIFAVLSARPKVTTLNREGAPMEEIRRNVVFFGNFVHLRPDQFEQAMEEVFNDSELLYGNMVRDLYYLGKVLDKKYRYLSISYNIFMVGFIATVGTFLIALFS